MYPSHRGRGRGSRGRRGGGGGRDGGRGRGRGSGRRLSSGGVAKDCLSYKLLGECERRETGECHFSHNNTVSTVRKTVTVPNKVPMSSAMKGDFTRSLTEISECRLCVSGESTIDIVVSEDNARHLPLLSEKYEILLSQLYPIGPGWCYMHRDGVSQCKAGSVLKFGEHRGRLPPSPGQILPSHILRELYISESQQETVADGESQNLTVENPERECETRRGLQRALNRAHGHKSSLPSNPPINRKDVGIKIIEDHENHMEGILQEALQWFCKEKRSKKPCVLKLEARFGKVLWRNIPEDVVESDLNVKNFADLCFSDSRHSRIFNTDVSRESVGKLKADLGDELLPSVLETVDVKFTIPRQRERVSVDVRIKFDESKKPILLLAKKNECKIIIFDVLSLHREYDARMTLNFYEIILPDCECPEYDLVQRLLKSVSYNPDDQTVSFQSHTQDWSVNFIRHKKRETLRIDDKQLLTVTIIKEFKDPKDKINLADDHQNTDPHIEVEFHNCAWECAFGRDVGLTKERSLSLHMANPEVELERGIPDPWLPEHILEDFKEFWESVDSINEILSH